MNARNRTTSEYIYHGLYFYFSGLSLRRTSERLSHSIKRNHVSIWNWIQKYNPQKISSKKNKVLEYAIDETVLKIGPEYAWLWVVIEVGTKEILGISISKERNMFVAERFISSLIKHYDRHPIYTDGGTWYPQACILSNINHHLHSFYEKSIIERTMQCIKEGMNVWMTAFHAG